MSISYTGFFATKALRRKVFFKYWAKFHADSADLSRFNLDSTIINLRSSA